MDASIREEATRAVEAALISHSVESRMEGVCHHQADIAVAAVMEILTRAAYADVITRIKLGTPYMTDQRYVRGAQWVESQIEDVLLPELES